MQRTVIMALGILCSTPSICSARTMDYDCDTGAGNYSDINMDVGSRAPVVRGVVTPKKLYKHDRWAPGATISVRSADEKDFVYFRAAARSPSKSVETDGEVVLGVAGNNDGAGGKLTYFGKVPMMTPIRFSISLEGDEAVISVGDAIRRLPFKAGDKPVVSVNCSTGQFLYSELEFPSQP